MWQAPSRLVSYSSSGPFEAGAGPFEAGRAMRFANESYRISTLKKLLAARAPAPVLDRRNPEYQFIPIWGLMGSVFGAGTV